MRTPPPRGDLRFSNTTGILPKKKKTMRFIGVEVEQETSAPPPKTKSWIRPWYSKVVSLSFPSTFSLTQVHAVRTPVVLSKTMFIIIPGEQ